MKCLVTGAGGFVGGALLRRLRARGATDVRALVRTMPPAVDRVAEVEYVLGDLRSVADCRAALDGVGLVYHVAGATKGSPADMVANTVVGSKTLLDAMVASGCRRVVLVSSFSVYGTHGLPAGALLDESTPLESHPERRDGYAYAKLRQEQLFWEYRDAHGIDVAVVRPGVVYGPSGRSLSPRVGLDLFGTFLHLGRDTVLPLTYVDNCAEAIAVVGESDDAWGRAFNAVDGDLPTSREFLREYRTRVRRVRTVTVPFAVLRVVSWMVERYHRHSHGQLPAIFTPYKSAMWRGHRYSNERLRSLGWRQIVPTQEGVRITMDYLKGQEGV
jgi:nucleoside-diphosphate-sugar epimerase